jgi:uncharacterized repeat protein (TIGR01451 family)
VITLTGGNLAPGASCTFSTTIQVPAAAAAGAYVNTTGSITGDVGGSPVIGSPAAETLFVSPAPILTKNFLVDPVASGGTTTIEFTITNSSPTSTATDVAFIDELTFGGPGTGFLPFPVSATLPAAGFCGPGATMALVSLGFDRQGLSMTGGSLAAGDSCTFTVDVDIPVGMPNGVYTNTTQETTATVDAATATGGPASDTLQVIGPPTLIKQFTDDPVPPGGTVTLEFTLSHSPFAVADATGITFTDDLTGTLAGLTATGLPQNDICGTGSQIDGTTNLSFTGGTLAPGESCTFSVTLQVPAAAPAGTHTNTTSNVVATSSGVTTTGLQAVDNLIVTGLTFSKSFTDDPAIPGGTVNLEFTIDNTLAPDGATAISFTDNLAANLAGLTPTGLPQNDICGAGSVLQAAGSLLIFSGGNLPAAGSCTFSVSVDVPGAAADGVYGNTTSSLQATVGTPPAAAVLPPAYDTLTVASDLLYLTKTFTDDPVAPGGNVTMEFTLSNLHPSQTATAIGFTDDLDAALTGLAVVGLPAPGFCGPGSTAAGAGVLTISGAELAPASSCIFSVTVQVPAVAPSIVTNTTSSISGTIGGLPVTGSAASDDLIITNLTFSKSFATASVPGQTVTLTFQIQNVGTSAVTLISFTDDLDAVIPGLVATGLPVNDVCGTGSQLAGTSVLNLTNANLLPGGSCTIPVTLQVPVTAVPGSFLNTTSDLSQAGLYLADPATADLVIEPPPVFSKVFFPNSIGVGLPSTLTFTIDNSASTFAATTLDFTDNLPAGVLVATPGNAATTCGGTVTAPDGSDVISLTGGSVGAGLTCTVTVDVTSMTPGFYANTSGDLTSSSGNSGPANDSLTVTTPLGFSKSFAPDPIPVGGVSTLTFEIDNQTGVRDIAGLSFTDNLPAGTEVASPANASTNCAGGTLTAVAGTGVVFYTGGTAPASSICNVVVDVLGTAVGTHVNTSGNLTSTAGISAPATDTLTVDPPPLATFAKVFSPDRIFPGAVSTLTFTIDNTAALVSATALDFTDNLPAGVEVANPANAGTTCTGGTLTAVPGSGVISYAGGTAGASASCTVSADVTSNTLGTHVNTSGDLTSSWGNSGPATDTLTVTQAPAFTKSFAPNPIPLDGISSLTFDIDNSLNVVDATSLDFTDNLPAGMTVANPANAATTCTGGTLTAVAGSTIVSYTGGTVTAGASCTVTVDILGSASGDLVNLSGNLTSSLGDSGQASDTLTVFLPPTMTKEFAPQRVVPGYSATIILTIDNTASAFPADNLNITDTFLAGMIVADPANETTTCIGGTITAVPGAGSISYTGGSVAAGEICTVEVDITITGEGSYVNTTDDLISSAGNSSSASAILQAALPIPTIGSWGVLILISLLGVVGVLQIRRLM